MDSDRITVPSKALVAAAPTTPEMPYEPAPAATQGRILLEAAQMATRAFRDADEAIDAVLDVMGRLLETRTVFLTRFDSAKGTEYEGEYDQVLTVRRVLNNGGPPLRPGIVGPLPQTYCYTIANSRGPLFVEDADREPAYQQLPVTKALGIRSYIGVPLLYSDGRIYGTLCGIDSHPLPLGDRVEHGELLLLMARMIMSQIEQEELNARLETTAAEAAARSSQVEATFEAIADGAMVCDAEGRVTQINAALRALLGLDAHPDAPARSLLKRWQVMPARDAQRPPIADAASGIDRLLRGEVLTGANMLDLALRAQDGREVELSLSGAPIRDTTGQITGAVCIFRDVSEQRRGERERTDMLNIVAHEIKQPLTGLKTRTQALRRRFQRGASVELRTLDHVEHDIARINVLTNDLVDAAHMESSTLTLDRQRGDLVALCQRAADDQMATSGRLITSELPHELVEFEGDMTRIEQVVTNLLSNALKYSPADSPVVLRIRPVEVKGGGREAGGARRVRVEVQDQGPGVPPEAMPRLFDRFYRAPGIAVQHGSGISLGLGLYISRRLIELHKGQIGVESAPGAGATFWFILPLASSSTKHRVA